MKVIVELIEDLNDYDDVDPTPGSGTKEVMAPPNSKHVLPHAGTDRCRAGSCRQASGMAGEYPVLCVAARRVLDESASRMLSQHSRKARRGARVISSDAVSRGAIGELVLAAWPWSACPTSTAAARWHRWRHLLRRIRRRFPGAPSLVGLWSPGEPLSDTDRQRAVGVDHCATSLRDAVVISLETVRAASAYRSLKRRPTLTAR